MKHKHNRPTSCIHVSREIDGSHFNIEPYEIVCVRPFLPHRQSGCFPNGQISWLICELQFYSGKAFYVYLYHLLLSFDLLNASSTVKFPVRVRTYEWNYFKIMFMLWLIELQIVKDIRDHGKAAHSCLESTRSSSTYLKSGNFPEVAHRGSICKATHST